MYGKKKFGICILAGILTGAFTAGCVSTANPAQQWVGRPATELLSVWGQPDIAVSLDDGRRILTWISYEEPGDILPCRRSFTVSPDGIVEKFSASACTSMQASPSKSPRERWR